MIATATPSQLEEYRQLAHQRLQEMNRSIVRLSEANVRLKAASESWSCTGQLQVGAALIHTSVRIDDMRFDSGGTLKFDGSGWGIGLGASGSSIGSGTFNEPPEDLLRRDKLKIQVFFLAAVVGGVEISFWNDEANEYLGVFVAGSIGAGAGSFGGDGKFHRV